MSDCKENVLEMIDGALRALNLESFCTCGYPVGTVEFCNYCKVHKGLLAARVCIVASVDRISIMRANMVAVQQEIEEKLKRILEV